MYEILTGVSIGVITKIVYDWLKEGISNEKNNSTLTPVTKHDSTPVTKHDCEIRHNELKQQIDSKYSEIRQDLKDFVKDNKEDHRIMFNKIDELRS